MNSRSLEKALAKGAAVAAALGLAFALALGAFAPSSAAGKLLIGGGLFMHAAGLGLLSFLVVAAFPRWWLAYSAVAALSGASVELLQPLFGRSSQWPDFAADLIGIAVGVALGLAFRSFAHRRGRSRPGDSAGFPGRRKRRSR